MELKMLFLPLESLKLHLALRHQNGSDEKMAPTMTTGPVEVVVEMRLKATYEMRLDTSSMSQ